MEKIPTAKEFLGKDCNLKIFYSSTNNNKEFIEIAMIEFAKIHVKKALEEAGKKAKLKQEGRKRMNAPTGSNFRTTPVIIPIYIVDKDSILNSYPEENIK